MKTSDFYYDLPEDAPIGSGINGDQPGNAGRADRGEERRNEVGPLPCL